MQALYFDKSHHNLTSARLWWDQHKQMFDSREKIMTHALKVVSKPVRRAAHYASEKYSSKRTSHKLSRRRTDEKLNSEEVSPVL
jgi:hypothetical protein